MTKSVRIKEFDTSKKPPYWVETMGGQVFLRGRNRFRMIKDGGTYWSKRESIQMAKRLAKNLGIEYRGER